ncbi:MAG TPA: hypothetical protein ENN05_06715 [Deltaproteobacteria bacterium]|nr:hypothetical protein [Deltaproteobacteria bacterium]
MKTLPFQSTKALALSWLFFSLIRFILGFIHIRAAMKTIKPIKFSISDATGRKISSAAQEELNRLISEVNDYIERYNQSSSRQHIITAFGYYAAALTALFSMLLILRSMMLRNPR